MLSAPEADTRRWLREVVVGLELCPFAAGPLRHGRVQVRVSAAGEEQALLFDLHDELEHLDSVSPQSTETTLLVVTEMLEDFDDFNAFLGLADALLTQMGFEERFQIASFHPRYRFEGTAPDDPTNLSNRSPWPVLHLLREESVAAALERLDRPADIYEANVRRLRALSQTEIHALFRYLHRG